MALAGVAIEGYAAFLAGNWAAVGHSVSSRPEMTASGEPTTASAPAVKLGDHMPGGTIYAGRSCDTGKPMYSKIRCQEHSRGLGAGYESFNREEIPVT